jgi:cardiolipin synthase
LNLPNLITTARILAIPLMVWAIAADQLMFAFVLFLLAGVTDAIDGFLAKHFGMASELGAYLDPLADKALIVSIYVTLGITEAVPRWIVILVVSRDIMIVAAIMLSWVVGKPIAIRPVMVSKLNTVAQILFAGLVLGVMAYDLEIPMVVGGLMALVALLTVLSAGYYVAEWVRHMNAAESGK